MISTHPSTNRETFDVTLDLQGTVGVSPLTEVYKMREDGRAPHQFTMTSSQHTQQVTVRPRDAWVYVVRDDYTVENQALIG